MSSEALREWRAWLARAALWLAIRGAIVAVILAVIGLIALVIAYFIVTPREFDLAAIERAGRLPGATFIDAKGELLATRGAFHGDDVKLDELPDYLVDAFLATEDRRFYKHHGIDLRGIARAVYTNIRLGYTAQGGSTITQQLAKNLFLSNERTAGRKFQEVLYAIWLERHLSKDQILELYLNRIYFGAGTYGVDAAARFYFNKPAREVTLAEAATLAGLPKAPTKFAPRGTLPPEAAEAEAAETENAEAAAPDASCPRRRGEGYLPIPEETRARAETVLKNLVEARMMEEVEIADALKCPAMIATRAELDSIGYYLDYVYKILYDVMAGRAGPAAPGLRGSNDTAVVVEDLPEPGLADEPIDLGTEDLVVYTTLDTGLQKKAEDAIASNFDRIADGVQLDVSQAALVSIEGRGPNNNGSAGAIRALVGGRSYIASQFNRATDAQRQPGSSFKPFVYLAALEHGKTPDDLVDDAPITIETPQGPWSPTNCTETYRGRVTLREALAYSLNTAAVRLSEEVGPEAVVEAAHRMGIASPLEPNHSIPLGTEEVNLLELTSAYLPFQLNGIRLPVHTILRVETKSGRVLYEYKPPEPVRVIDAMVATEMTGMLFEVIYSGTGKAARLRDRPAAGKTGTTQDWRDAWFMGYTAELVTGVWVGNDDNHPMMRVAGGGLPAQIWGDYMTAATEGVKVTALPGAAPARASEAADELRGFYADLAGDLRSVGSGGNPATVPRFGEDGDPRPRFPWER